MNNQVRSVAAVLMLGVSLAWASGQTYAADPGEETRNMPAGMDHGAMDHGGMGQDTMPGMNHGGMDHSGMVHNAMPGMDHGSMQGGPAPSDARGPHDYSGGYDFGSIPRPRMGDEELFGSLLIDRLEAGLSCGTSSQAYDLQSWFGKDYDRAVLKAEGDIEGGEARDAHTDLLWGHAVAAYWDTQLGVRHDTGTGPERSWLAFGVQGLAPYWFELDITAYLGEEGLSLLQLETEYELLITQKLILQPRIEAKLYGKRDAERGLGSGLANLAAGVRLRYEIRREFAPYLGIEWVGKFGRTAEYARTAGEESEETRLVAGVRFWY